MTDSLDLKLAVALGNLASAEAATLDPNYDPQAATRRLEYWRNEVRAIRLLMAARENTDA